MHQALILFAHGSRKTAWKEPFEYLQDKLKQQNIQVELCFLEIMQPSLHDCINNLVKNNFTHIIIAPIFLGKGGHIERDLPELVKYNQQIYPFIQFTVLPFIGERKYILDAICKDIYSQI